MTIKAVYFDFGGVIQRTEFQAPRQHLADGLGIEYEDLVKAVFDSPTAIRATVGEIPEEAHWAAVMRRFRLPADRAESFAAEFFAGDVTDLVLLDAIRDLHKTVKIGLISNAWSGLRPWIVGKKFDDCFDVMIISAEVKQAKPEAPIFHTALEALGVSPAEAAFLDDFPANVAGANAVGMHAIHFAQPEKALDELQKLLDLR
ncbi:MAG TPA: HAD family phosphatase [Anaerolineales bacterium]|nr:HAD family phosphatase [Anaerolineales bacterium]